MNKPANAKQTLQNDDPLQPRNGEPYPLTLHAIKRLTYRRGGDDHFVEAGSEMWLRSGDVVQFSKAYFV